MSLADGGVPVEDLSQGYPEADWDTVLGDMFLESRGEKIYSIQNLAITLIRRF
ncbi:MAG: hypothetical protein ACREAE_01760 [Nitrosopumilaceae archaeon]